MDILLQCIVIFISTIDSVVSAQKNATKIIYHLVELLFRCSFDKIKSMEVSLYLIIERRALDS